MSDGRSDEVFNRTPDSTTPLRVQVGKWYRTRAGDVVQVTHPTLDSYYPFAAGETVYTATGRYYALKGAPSHPSDLVAEIEIPELDVSASRPSREAASTKAEYFSFHRAFCDRMVEVTQRKNADYTGDAGDPFANFRVVEKLGVCSVEVGFLVRMSDKMIRIANLADGRAAQVKDEAIDDTLHDLANYCALFAGYLAEKRKTKKTEDGREAA